MFNEEENVALDTYDGDAFEGDVETKFVPAGGHNSWRFQLKSSGDPERVTLMFEVHAGPDENEAPEWSATLKDAAGFDLWESEARSGDSTVVELDGSHPKELELNIGAPKGARYNDEVKIGITAISRDLIELDVIRFEARARASILALKTQIGHEKAVADGVASKAKDTKGEIFAILSPTTLRGYVLVEAMNTDRLRDTVKGVKKARRFVDGETALDEIDHYLTPKPLVSGITEGDVVELVSGPFKGEKARVMQIDESKEEITVELFEAMVPIPVTIRGDHVRVIEKER